MALRLAAIPTTHTGADTPKAPGMSGGPGRTGQRWIKPGHGVGYRRYSDDILLICPPDKAAETEKMVEALIADENLTLSPEKTECQRSAFG